MNEEEIISKLKAIDMWYDVGEKYSIGDLNAIEGILKLYQKKKKENDEYYSKIVELSNETADLKMEIEHLNNIIDIERRNKK